jgi:uncharacterized protein (DUF1697 family)
MLLAIRDRTIQDLQKQIEERKSLLIEKHKSLKTTIKENEFLEEVSNDYDKHYNFIKKQKEEQIVAFETINDYLEKIILETKLTNSSLTEAKHEQRTILDKINKIKKELEDLINVD